MTLEDLANLGEALGGIAVLVSLVYLAVQIRQNTKAVRASAFQQVVDSFSDISLEISKDASLTELFQRASEDPSSLSEIERARFFFLLMSLFRRAENVFFQAEEGTLLEPSWQGIRGSLDAIINLPGAREFWAETENRERFNPSFRAFLDSLLR